MATSNRHKFGEASMILSEMGIVLRMLEVKRIEVQAEDPATIAEYSLEQLKEAEDRPVVVEDAGIFIEHYGGFPGPYSSYALHTIGLMGVLKLMEGVENRNATFQSVVAYRYRDKKRTFRGVVEGKIAHHIKGTGGFGYDPIFIPDEGDGRTFGEMASEEKNTISHRARAFRSLGEWLASDK